MLTEKISFWKFPETTVRCREVIIIWHDRAVSNMVNFNPIVYCGLAGKRLGSLVIPVIMTNS